MITNSHQHKLGFIAVGPQRTGSTWLHQVLGNHPDLALPSKIKETMFFDKYYHKGSSWLFSHYQDKSDRQILGEIAPTYFDSEIALNRIKSDHPDCKIVINVRNPIDHAYSMYQHELSKGRIRGTFADVLQRHPEKILTSRYAKWVPIWQQSFGDGDVCLVWMDEIENQPQLAHKKVCEFLGISADHYAPAEGARKVNASKQARFPAITRFGVLVYHFLREYRLHAVINFCKRINLHKITFGSVKKPENSQLTPSEFSTLVTICSDDIAFLERLSNQDLSHWRKPDSKFAVAQMDSPDDD